MKKKVFNIIQIGDKSNRLSRLFDIFIAIVICANILVTFLQTFDELAFLFPVFHVIEVITILIFCVEYILRIWTADYLYPDKSELRSRLRFLISFDGIIDLLTILPFFFLSGMVIFRMLRVARIFHLFRLNARYDSFNVITTVLYEKRNQIISSVFIVLILMLASSLCMYSMIPSRKYSAMPSAASGGACRHYSPLVTETSIPSPRWGGSWRSVLPISVSVPWLSPPVSSVPVL
jgi:voltage-gated potassium channel